MPLSAAVASRLAARLRPHLLLDPIVDVDLGLLRSDVTLTGLVLDPAPLDALLRDSTRLECAGVTVDEVRIGVSLWSRKGISVDVRGVRVDFVPRKAGEDVDLVYVEDSAAVQMRKVLESLDPQGVVIHDIIRDSLYGVSPGNRVVNVLRDALMHHVKIQFQDICFQLELVEGSYIYLLKTHELAVESRVVVDSCLLTGVLGALFLPRKDVVVGVTCGCLELQLKDNDQVKHLVSSRGLSSFIKLRNLRMVGFSLCILRADFDFSPGHIRGIFVMSDLFTPGESKVVRKGRDLWRLAAGGIKRLNSCSHIYNLFSDSVAWLHYVRAYEKLLSSVGFCDDGIIQCYGGRLHFRESHRLVDHRLKLVDEMEKKLSPELVARARRIARHRASIESQNNRTKLAVPFIMTFSWKLYTLLSFLPRILFYIFGLVSRMLFIFRSKYHPDNDQQIPFLSSVEFMGLGLEDQLYINMGEIHISICPSRISNDPVTRSDFKNTTAPGIDLFSVHLKVKTFSFLRFKDRISQSMYIAVGDFETLSSYSSGSSSHIGSFLGAQTNDISLESYLGSHNDMVSILLSEPALLSPPKEVQRDDLNSDANPWFSMLNNYLGELQSDWGTICKEISQKNSEFTEHPFVLCKLKYSLVEPNLISSDYGLLKCLMVAGKLNFNFNSSSTMLISLVTRQMWQALQFADRAELPSVSPTAILGTTVKLEEQLEFYISKMKMSMLNIIPQNKVQVGVLIGGVKLKISSLEQSVEGITINDNNSGIGQGFKDTCCSAGLDDIVITLWPASKDVVTDFSQELGRSGEVSDYLWLKQPRMLDFPEARFHEAYSFIGRTTQNIFLSVKGLWASMENLEEDQHSPAICPMSVQVKSSIYRDHLFSLFSSADVFSMALDGVLMGAAALSYMDDLYNLLQVLERINTLLFFNFNNFNSAAAPFPEEMVMRHIVPTTGDSESIRTSSEACSSLQKEAIVMVDVSLELESLDIILSNPREQGISRTNESYGSYGAYDLPGLGVGISFKKSLIHVQWDNEHVKMLIDLQGIESVLFVQREKGLCADLLKFKSHESQLFNLLHKLSICAFIFSSYADLNDKSSPLSRVKECGDSSVPAGPFVSPTLPYPTCLPGQVSNFWLLFNVDVSEVIIANYHMKILPNGKSHPSSMKFSLSVSREPYKIDSKIQGGYFFIETPALAAFLQCLRLYSQCLTCLPVRPSEHSEVALEAAYRGASVPSPNGGPARSWGEIALQFSETFSLDMLGWNLTFAITNELGDIQKLSFEVDAGLKLVNSGRKFMFGLSRLTVLSEQIQGSIQGKMRITPIPHFRSTNPSNTLSFTVPEAEMPFLALENKHFTHLSDSLWEPVGGNGTSNTLNVKYDGGILKNMVSSITYEKTFIEVGPQQLTSYWVGNGSISGCDIALTPSDIQMILALIAPLSVLSTGKADNSSKPSSGATDEKQHSLDNIISDGAIVAIEDVDQHLYFAIEDLGTKYNIVGVLHYSLAGERALFKVKYQNKRRWGSHVSRFYLMSLNAKDEKEKPLFLNYSPGSGFVEISSSDGKWALWETFPLNSDSYENDDGVKYFGDSARRAFHLINSNSGYAVAFVDGAPEFVKKPGNPFKVKVFSLHDFVSDAENMMVSNLSVANDTRFSVESISLATLSGRISNIQCLTIIIDKITLTISHKVADANEMFPLIQSSVNDLRIITQILPSKFRIISSFKFAAFCFDNQQNVWREIISTFPTSLFLRSRFTPCSENSHGKAPVHFHCCLGQVNVPLSELSLDILLFSFWKLNILSPYDVRRSVIFGNFCKVENNLGLNLRCNFSNGQEVLVAANQSTSAMLRHNSAETESSQDSFVSVHLSNGISFSTSPIQISLVKPCLLAWRTRLMSLQDSRTFPGPFLVAEVSKKTEDGRTVILSPLLRIRNESGFHMKLRFQRPHESLSEAASVLVRNGDAIDDSMAVFDALNHTGGLKKALMSLGLGNFLLSVRPEITDNSELMEKSVSVEWSGDIKGGKAIRISGLFDKLNYRFKKAFGVESTKSFFSTICCHLIVDGLHSSDVYFIIQTIGRDVPVMPPQKASSEAKSSPVAFQLQKEIFIFPTIKVLNLLQTEIVVSLYGENSQDLHLAESYKNFGKKAKILCGSSAHFYVNPDDIHFNITLSAFNSKCNPVNSRDWVNKLLKQKKEINHFDIVLDFGGGKYFPSLRLSRGDKGILEATIFTSYSIHNNTEISIICMVNGKKREEAGRYNSSISPEFGLFLPPNSSGSWFFKSNKLHVEWVQEKESGALLDLDVLSGVTELSLHAQSEPGVTCIAKLGVSLASDRPKLCLPSQIVRLVPRYIIANESTTTVLVRQCYLEDGLDQITSIEGNKRAVLYIQENNSQRRETNLFDSAFRKHINDSENCLKFIQFHLEGVQSNWSGPICIASLGRFFLKFKKVEPSPPNVSRSSSGYETIPTEFASVHILEENSSLVLHFYMPPNITLPYRIENCLHNAAISYYQKESAGSETLPSGTSIDYVWDDLNLPHKLVVQIAGASISREINIDKVCSWRPFIKTRQTKGLLMHLPLESRKKFQIEDAKSDELDVLKLGYEVSTDGLTRVVRICEVTDSHKEEKILAPYASIQFRFASLVVNLLECSRQDDNIQEAPAYSTIVVTRLVHIAMDSVVTYHCQYNTIRIQSINVDEKWQEAPFASMFRRSQLNDSSLNENMLCIVFHLNSRRSNVKQVEYASLVLQPVDLNLDEETLMRLVKFWRTSLSDSQSSTLFYFNHFEIHPIKINASFLPGNQYSSYSSTQEALRSLLHNVIKVPPIRNTTVELNGVLLTHALVTTRELGIKCMQHYSWYLVRAVYQAKGSQLLPPAFASIFDDSASSSLDVFFDPSNGSINLPGVTLGMFKFIRTCISSKGFSGTKRYFGDLGKTVRRAGSNAVFVAVTEISDSVLLGAETSGFSGLVSGFHQGILKLAMEPSMISAAVMEGGPDRKINLDRNPGVDELYIEGYLQAMLDGKYKQEYLRVRVKDNQVILKNLPPNNSLINEIVGQVRNFLTSRGLLKGEASTSRSIRQLRRESEWRVGPTVLTLFEHLFVSFAIRLLRKQTTKVIVGIRSSRLASSSSGEGKVSPTESSNNAQTDKKSGRLWGLGRFALSGVVAYLDGRLCRHIPNPIARRIVSGYLLSFLEKNDSKQR